MKRLALVPILSLFAFSLVHAQSTPNITSIQSGGNPTGTVNAGEKASIYGSGFTGAVFVKVGVQEVQTTSINVISDSYAEFTVPARSQSVTVGIAVTNADGVTSNYYTTTIDVPATQITPSPTISFLQSPAEYANVLHPGERTTIYGSRLKGDMKVQTGSQSQWVYNQYDSTLDFYVPQMSSGTIGVSLTNSSGQESNTVQVQVVGRTTSYTAMPVATPAPAAVTPTTLNVQTVAPTIVSNTAVQQQIVQLQTLLMQLIQQLIALLQQQATAGN